MQTHVFYVSYMLFVTCMLQITFVCYLYVFVCYICLLLYWSFMDSIFLFACKIIWLEILFEKKHCFIVGWRNRRTLQIRKRSANFGKPSSLRQTHEKCLIALWYSGLRPTTIRWAHIRLTYRGKFWEGHERLWKKFTPRPGLEPRTSGLAIQLINHCTIAPNENAIINCSSNKILRTF